MPPGVVCHLHAAVHTASRRQSVAGETFMNGPPSVRNFLVSAAAPLLARTRPNIIFILIDDLGYGDLGITGNRDVPTPHMDSIGRDGIRFTQFYCASPVCSPSRVGFTTGQYPARHRINTFLNSRQTNRENN